jgi:hypothetical protein
MKRAALFLVLAACCAAGFAMARELRLQVPVAHAGLALAMAVVLVLLAGVVLGYWLRGHRQRPPRHADAGDTHAHMDFPPALPRRVRAGNPPPLPYSFDGRRRGHVPPPAAHH